MSFRVSGNNTQQVISQPVYNAGLLRNIPINPDLTLDNFGINWNLVGNCEVINSNTVKFLSIPPSQFGYFAYSSKSIIGDGYISFKCNQTNSYFSIGFSENPNTYPNLPGYDDTITYGFFVDQNTNLYSNLSGSISLIGNYSTYDTLKIIYKDNQILMLLNDTRITVLNNITNNNPLYFKVSFGGSNTVSTCQVNNILFGSANDYPFSGGLYYDLDSQQIQYSSQKNFIIPHPIHENKYLIHACLEGPEAGVYYRGEGQITNHEVEISLPDYASKFTDLTVHVTPIFNGGICKTLNVSKVIDNKFKVFGEPGEFNWIVFGKRESILIEPDKNEVHVEGIGPYKWYLN